MYILLLCFHVKWLCMFLLSANLESLQAMLYVIFVIIKLLYQYVKYVFDLYNREMLKYWLHEIILFP